MTTIIFLKAHVRGYTRRDGTVVAPHEDKRTKKAAPAPGQRSLLDDEAAEPQRTIDTPAFKAWFGDSKVIDSSGKPLRVFHGNAFGDSFSTFDAGKAGSTTESSDAKLGFFFTDSAHVAGQYAKLPQSENEAHTERVSEHIGDLIDAGASEKDARKTGGQIIPTYLLMENPLVVDRGGEYHDADSYADIIHRAKAGGHDGAIIKNTGENDNNRSLLAATYVVFSAAQIKSATGNSGAFDPANPDITKAIVLLKARDRHDSGTGDMFAPLPGTHVETHTRKDGVVQTYHVSAPAQHAPAVHVVFVHHKPVDTLSNMSNNEPVNNTGGIMEMTMTRAAMAERKGGTARLDECLAKLAQYTAADSVIKSRFAELRSSFSGCYNDAAKATVSRAYLAMNPRPDGWASDVYYDIGSPVSMKKCLRAAMPYAGKSDFADLTIAFISEWTPVFAQLDALKTKITTTTAIRTEKKETAAREQARIPKTKLSMEVHAAVQAYKPELEKRYVANVQSQHDWLVRELGEGMPKLSSSRLYKVFENSLAAVCDDKRNLVPALVEEAAKQYANDVADYMAGKIMSKLGEIDNPAVDYLNGMGFVVTGEMHGKPVRIAQRMIINVSVLGTLFNQFPARISYDGKAISEAAFKTLQVKK